MKKIVTICLIVLCMCLCLTGCSEYADAWQRGVEAGQEKADQLEYYRGIFEVVFEDSLDGIVVLRDTVTDVLYVKYSSGYRGGLTVMLNADGTPLLYSEWLELCGIE